MVENIRAIMIFEILGKPAEHIIDALKGIISKMGGDKGIRVIEKKIQEPKSVDDSDLFSSFAEVEIEIEGMQKLLLIMFNYMPAHIEILSPSELRIKNFDLCSVCNDLMTKLHAYDSVAKTLIAEKNNLINQVNQIAAKFQSIQSAQSEQKTEQKPEKSQKKKKK